MPRRAATRCFSDCARNHTSALASLERSIRVPGDLIRLFLDTLARYLILCPQGEQHASTKGVEELYPKHASLHKCSLLVAVEL